VVFVHFGLGNRQSPRSDYCYYWWHVRLLPADAFYLLPNSYDRSSGGANISAPLNGGFNGDLFYVFQHIYNVPTRTPTPSSTSTPPPLPHATQKTGIIAGATLGSVIFLAVGVGAAIILRRRRRRGKKSPERGRDDDKMVDGDGVAKKAPLLTSAELSGNQQLPAELHDDQKEKERAELWSPPAELPATEDLGSAPVHDSASTTDHPLRIPTRTG
jgi:hypothetical protein